MSGSTETFFEWERFPSALKHQIVGGYLRDAFPVMLQRFDSDVVYADLFAGAGRYDNGAPGSPLIAANLAARRPAGARRILCFNVEANPVFFNQLEQNTAHLPPGVVINRFGPWQGHFSELERLMSGRPAIVFMDPFRLDVALDDIGGFVQQIGAEPRDLILMLNIHGLQRIANAKAAEDARRSLAAEFGGDVGMPPGNYYARPHAVLGGRWWLEHLVDGRLPESAFAAVVRGYCDQLARLGSTDSRPLRRAVAVPIPYRLGGSTSYYLVLVTRSPKALVLFSDAADRAISAAWRVREAEERTQSLPPPEFMPLFADLPAPEEPTYETRRADVLTAISVEVMEQVSRSRWPLSVRDLHEALVTRYCGLFHSSHLSTILRQLRDVGRVEIEPRAITPKSRLSVVRSATGRAIG